MTFKTTLRSLSFVLAASVASISFAQSTGADAAASGTNSAQQANPNVGDPSTTNNRSANAAGTPSTATSGTAGADAAGAMGTGSTDTGAKTTHKKHKKHSKMKKSSEGGMNNATGAEDNAVKPGNKNATKQ